MPNTTTRDDFANEVNGTFLLIDGSGAELALKLSQVSELRRSQQQEIFSLVFKGPIDRLLPQQIYQMEHEKLGQLDIFVVPIKRDADAIYYEAVFNRLVSANQ